MCRVREELEKGEGELDVKKNLNIHIYFIYMFLIHMKFSKIHRNVGECGVWQFE